MVGSKKDFEYTTDDGQEYVINMDESNGEAVGNTDYSAASTATMRLPSNCKPRYALYTSPDGNTRRKVVIGSNTATTATLAATIDVANGLGGTVTLGLSFFKGEEMRLIPRADDTGLTDGDPD